MRRLVLCLLLACLTTLSIAWLLAALIPIPMYPRRIARDWMGDDGRVWGAVEVVLPGVHDVWWLDLKDSYPGTPDEVLAAARAHRAERELERRSTDLHFRVASGLPSWGTFARGRAGPPNDIGSDTAFGWPWPCLWFSVRAETRQTAQGSQIVNDTLVGAIPIAGEPSARIRNFRALPYLVRWPALALDAAFWTAAWWLLITIPLALRRRARLRRGRCPACGYDLAGIPDSACPECGAVPARVVPVRARRCR